MSDIVDLGREPSIPAIPQTPIDDPKIRPVVDAIRNIFRTRTSGDQLDNWVTWRHLVDGGIVGYKVGNNISYGQSSNFFPANSTTLDYTPPPAPHHVVATGGFNVIFLEWQGDNYGNHAYTEVWRSGTNLFSTAVLQGTTKASMYVDSVGNNQNYYYWFRFVSNANVYGPYNSTEGTLGKTSLDPAYVLETLSGQITESQLYSSLNSRISLIDAPSTTSGSVSARIATEANTRATVDNGLLAQYTVKVDVNGRVAGFGLASTTSGGTPSSSFIVIADKFAVVSPSNTGETPKVPFVIGTVDGQTVVAISSAMIQDAAISTAKIGTAVITTAKIADAAIDNAKIADASITTAKITDAAITNAKIGYAAVGTANITDGAIVNAKIGYGEITEAKIADGNITNAKIAYAAITEAKIADGNITNAKIGYAAIDNTKIQDGQITNAKIAYAAIDNAKIQDGAITNAKIADAQITNAKIGTAEVSTLTIQGNAVTIPVAATAQNWYFSYASNIIVSVYIESSGGPKLIQFACSTADCSSMGDGPGTYAFNLLRDGVYIAGARTVGSSSACISFTDYASAGGHTYAIEGDVTLNTWNPYHVGATFFNTISVLEVKR